MVSCFSRLSQFECDWNSGEWLLAISVALKHRESGGELNSVFEFPAPVLPGSEPLWFCTNWYCYALFYLGKSCGLHRSLLGVVSSRAEHLVDGLDDEPLCVWSELDVTHRSSAARPQLWALSVGVLALLTGSPFLLFGATEHTSVTYFLQENLNKVPSQPAQTHEGTDPK